MTINYGANKNTLGRGSLFFDRFLPNTATRQGELHLGNTPELGLNVETEKLEHYSSERGLKTLDDSVTLQVSRSGSFITDHINVENMELFFFGVGSTVTQVATPVADEAITVQQGRHYQLGQTAGNPQGIRGIGSVSVQDDTDTTTYVEDTDYSLELGQGRIYIIPGGGISDDDVLHIDYTPEVNSRSRIITEDNVIFGALRFLSQNPTGDRLDHYWPKTQLSPGGDFALKGDEWQQMPFGFDILKLDDATAAHYIDGQPA